MQPTLRDVARAAGVHPATVSRSLNPATRHLVNWATADRVRKAAEKLGYVPNPIARGLKTNRSATFGVVIPDLTNPLFPPILRGIEDLAMAAGYIPLVVNTVSDPAREKAQIAALRARQVEGLIVATAQLKHPLLEQLRDEGFPVVLLNRRVEELEVPMVGGDDESGIAMAVNHLVALGHHQIAHIAGPVSTSTGAVRLRAFRSALSEHGIEMDERLVRHAEQFQEEDGERLLADLLDSRATFTAVVAGNDLIAIGCYDTLADRGLSCPEDLSVVGFNDMPFVDKLRPAMTSVRVPHYDIGAEAARLLLEQLDNGLGAAKSVLLPLSLSVRDSTAPPRGAAS